MKLVLSGSGSGLGRQLALHWLQAGHEVHGLGRSDQSDLAARWPGFQASRADVTDFAAVAAAAREVGSRFGRVDALVTCAAVHGEIAPALRGEPAQWSAAVRTSLDGTYHCLRAFAPLLDRAERRAKVVCFSGGGATRARPGFSAYGAAKTAVVRLVETIAEEEQGRPFDINAVAPGALPTRLTAEILAAGPERAGRTEVEAARAAQAAGPAAFAEVLALADWLLSPASDGVSGRLISAAWDDWRTWNAPGAAPLADSAGRLRRAPPPGRGA